MLPANGRDTPIQKKPRVPVSAKIIDLLAILQKSLDRLLFSYNFIHEARSSGVTASINIVHIQKFFKCRKILFDSDSFQQYL